MTPARLENIFVAATKSGPISEVAEVTAVAGAGLVGDRTWQGDLPEDQREAKREVTLFSKEAVDAANQASGLGVAYTELRRNLMTTGVDLAALVGKRFRVGEVELEGIKVAHPCLRLQEMAGKPLLKPFIDSAGLRARIVTGGTIRRGDPIEVPAS